MKFGLNDTTIERIQKVFETSSKVDEVTVFGSRAKGNYKEGSDIDLAVKGHNIAFKDILSITERLDDLNLPYEIDLINYSTINDKAVVEHIDRVGIVFFKRRTKVRLGDYVDVINGHAFKSSNFLNNKTDNALPVIKIKNVANGDVHLNDVQYHLYEPTLKKFLIEKDDILIALTGNHPEVMTQVVGDASLYKLNEKALLNQRVAKVIAKEGLDKNYLYYFLKDDVTHNALASNSAGSANQANVSKTDVENLPILLPPLNEQTSIANTLKCLDDKIDLVQRQNKTLEQLAETLFRQWFVEEADESWERKPLDEIASYLNGLALQKYKIIGNDYLPVIKIRELKQGISENTDTCSSDIPKQYIVHDGDILFSWSGSLEVVIWHDGDGALNQHLFKVTSDKFPKWFYYLATKSHLQNFRAIAETKSTTMGHIQREHLTQALVSIPPEFLFEQYDKCLSPLIDKIINNNMQLKQLTQLRDALLPKLMSGEVMVN